MTIRRFPDDFVVRERLDDAMLKGLTPSRTDQSPFAVFQMVKMSVTTPNACAALARELGIRAADIQFAGMKDKHACTSQIVTAKVATQARATMIPAQVSLQNVTADLVGWSAQHVKAEDIAFNAFEIVVRDLTTQHCDVMNRNASRACLKSESQPTLLMPNYFGDQRFGYQRADTLAARLVVHGDYLAALKLIIATPHRKDSGIARETNRLCAMHWGKWPELLQALPRSPARKVIEVLANRSDTNAARDAFAALPYIEQQMCIESFQSHLWNATVAAIVSGASTSTWKAPGATGELLFVESVSTSQHLASAQLPMPSPELALPATDNSNAWFRPALAAAMEREQLALSQLQVPGLRRPSFDNFSRPLFVQAHDFSMTPPERDEASTNKSKYKRTLRFSLPRGAYATVLLRMLGQ
ncbi:MAG: tRNA pseudouridine(13) synthase TruD [Phycisphaerales bacterium]